MSPLQVERYWPFAVGFAVGGGAGWAIFSCETEPPPTTIPVASMTFGIIVAGFTATQRNMLLTMSGSRVLRFLTTTRYYNDVILYFMQCIYAGLFLTLLSVGGLFLGDNELFWSLWLSGLVFAITSVLGLVLRNEIVAVRLVKRFIEEQK